MYIENAIQRFSITSNREPFYFRDSDGVIIEARNDLKWWFPKGFITVADNGRRVNFHTTEEEQLQRTFLMQIGPVIRVKFELSRDKGVLAKHVRLPGDRVPRELVYETVVIFGIQEPVHPIEGVIEWWSTEEEELYHGVWRQRTDKVDVFLPEKIATMFQHLKNQERLTNRTSRASSINDEPINTGTIRRRLTEQTTDTTNSERSTEAPPISQVAAGETASTSEGQRPGPTKVETNVDLTWVRRFTREQIQQWFMEYHPDTPLMESAIEQRLREAIKEPGNEWSVEFEDRWFSYIEGRSRRLKQPAPEPIRPVSATTTEPMTETLNETLSQTISGARYRMTIPKGHAQSWLHETTELLIPYTTLEWVMTHEFAMAQLNLAQNTAYLTIEFGAEVYEYVKQRNKRYKSQIVQICDARGEPLRMAVDDEERDENDSESSDGEAAGGQTQVKKFPI